MDEQPTGVPPHREPADGTRRRRAARPTFKSPVNPETDPTTAEKGNSDLPPERPRRTRPAPSVLFQPPSEPDALARAEPERTAPTAEHVTDATEPVGRTTPESDVAHADATAPPPVVPAQRGGDATAGPDDTGSAPPDDGRAAVTETTAGTSEFQTVEAPAGERPPRKAAAPAKSTTATTPRKAAPSKGTTSKATTARKTGRPRKAADLPPSQDAAVLTPSQESAPEKPTAGRPVEPARTAIEGLPATVARALDHPGFAPELLALAAVRTLGPVARDWAAWHLATYPGATADGLARLATRRFVRLAGAGGATAALAGVFAPVAELAAALWTQASLVLHLAAAYGRDPLDRERAVELLVLTRVHPDAESARSALVAAEAATGPETTTATAPEAEAATGSGAKAASDPGQEPWPRAVEAAWRLAAPLAAQTGGWLGQRLVSRLVPGTAALAAALGGSAAAERLAARAVAAYRPPRARR